MKFEKQVLDRHGPAQVGFDCHAGGLTVYCGVARHPTTKLVSLRLTRESGYETHSQRWPWGQARAIACATAEDSGLWIEARWGVLAQAGMMEML
jgi:hypothetical protein